MKAPSGAEHAPTNRMDQAVPPMKATDPQTADTGSKTETFTATGAWIGRSVYSSDDKEFGKVASVQNGDLQADLGGFLGIGATRTLIKSDQIQEVRTTALCCASPKPTLRICQLLKIHQLSET
jgi:hypothetical protein